MRKMTVDNQVAEQVRTDGAASRVSQDRPQPRPEGRGRRLIGQLFTNYGVLLFFLALAVAFVILLPDRFPTGANIQAIVGDASIPIIVALAAMLPLVAGEFDLSVGANLGFTAILSAWLSIQGWELVASIGVALLVSLLIGLVNAVLVAFVGVNAFIATLGMATILAGGNLFLTGGAVLFEGISPSFTALADGNLGGIPLVTFYAVAVVAVVWYLLERTPRGRYLRSTGLGRDAARLSGVKTTTYLVSAFLFSALLSGLAGVLLTARTGSATPTAGPDFLLPAYAAAFLGATMIRPGFFNVFGTVAAVFALAIGINGLNLMGSPFWVPNVFNGTALLVAVSASLILGRRSARRRARGGGDGQ